MDEIMPFDWARMFLGEAPLFFHAEILFRVLMIWVWTAVLLRWIGARSISQLSLVEFLLVIALGSAVGDSMFYPEVPILHAMLVVLILVLLDRLIDYLMIHWPRFKNVIDSPPIEVVRQGVITCEGIGARNISTLEVMEMLRLKGVENLGTVRSAWLEASGNLSLFAQEPPQFGLPIMPPPELRNTPPFEGAACCANCGMMQQSTMSQCFNCNQERWLPAEQAPPYR